MKCPFCNHGDTQVKDTRPSSDGASIRRRRICPNCAGRFTTFERPQLRELVVVKRNGARETFDRDKIERSLQTALRKRPVNSDVLESVTNGIVQRLEQSGNWEISTQTIGEMVMDALKQIDQIGYVRYASVYRDFKEIGDFESFISGELRPEHPSKPSFPTSSSAYSTTSNTDNADNADNTGSFGRKQEPMRPHGSSTSVSGSKGYESPKPPKRR